MSTLKATNIKNESSASNNIVLDSGGGVVVSGILTATTFSGDGSGLSGIDATQIVTGNTSVQTVDTGSDGHVKINTEGAERVRVDSSGRLLIGIGTARTNIDFYSTLLTPTGQIEGTSNNTSSVALISNNSTDNVSSQLHFCKSGTDGVGNNGAVVNNEILGRISFSGNDGTNFLSGAEIVCAVDGTPGTNDMPSRLTFRTTADNASSSTERVRILSSGGFRATTTGSYENTSAAHHEFVTTGNNNIMNIYHTDSNGGNCGGFYVKFTNAAPNGTGLAYRFDDSAAMRFLVRTNGGIANYQSNDSNLCDEREKKNIVDLDSTWDCLKHWELKKFHYNEDDNDSDLRYGVIAQQISLHCPEVITEWIKQDASEAVLDEDGNEIEPAKEEIVRLAVKEQQMYWMAIKALQEAQERIETLEAQNAAILARLDAAGI